jgi:uncharacterized membrane protein
MDLTYLHLILNHIPVIGVIIGFLILAWATLRGYEEVKNTGLVVLVLTALVAIPVYLTGEPAEEVVEHLPGVSEQIIELHEGAALYSLILVIVSGALALLALVAKRFLSAKVSVVAVYACLVFSLIAAASLAYTANLGGQIRHSEIRQVQSGNPNAEIQPEKKKDDDDHSETKEDEDDH